MARVRAIDGTHDWKFGQGRSDYVVNNAAIAQNIDTRLNSFLGNCFFDLGAGLDWFNLLGAKDLTALNLAISSIILNTDQVISIIELTSGLDIRRNFLVSYKVKTVYSSAQSTFSFDNSIG